MKAVCRLLIALVLGLAACSALAAQGFTLSSPAIQEGGRIPLSAVHASCGGDDISPPLAWSNPPAGTHSYAVTLFDPDAAGGFWHWIAFNIPVGTHSLDAGAGNPRAAHAPSGMLQLRNDFGQRGYSGPCPPPGKAHHYVFTVYALDVSGLGSGSDSSRQRVLAALKQHALARATLTAAFGR